MARQRLDLKSIQQIVKWIVYAILVVNFFFYLLEDINAAKHSLPDGGTFLEWANAFATAIDELAWFALLFLFELETYALSDQAFEGFTGWLIRGTRIVCYAVLAHTVYAYAVDVIALERTLPLPGITEICQLADQGMSYTYNLAYTVIGQSNCADLSTGTRFFPAGSDSVVTDAEGLVVSRLLAWADLAEAVIWLLIVFLIEFMVFLQNRDISTGRLITAANIAKPVLYGMLILISLYWGIQEQWLYVWDEFIWIAGFMAIEINVVEWRDELQEEAEERRLAG